MILNGLKYANEDVVALPAKANVLKFSIFAEGSAELVTISSVSSTRKIIRCHSGSCNVLKGTSKRCLENLGNAESICAHLSAYRSQNGAECWDGIVSDDDDDNCTLPREKVSRKCFVFLHFHLFCGFFKDSIIKYYLCNSVVDHIQK